jgi:hypothetical protein
LALFHPIFQAVLRTLLYVRNPSLALSSSLRYINAAPCIYKGKDKEARQAKKEKKKKALIKTTYHQF